MRLCERVVGLFAVAFGALQAGRRAREVSPRLVPVGFSSAHALVATYVVPLSAARSADRDLGVQDVLFRTVSLSALRGALGQLSRFSVPCT